MNSRVVDILLSVPKKVAFEYSKKSFISMQPEFQRHTQNPLEHLP